MRTLKLYEYAEQQGVAVYCCPLPETGSMSLPMGDKCVIGIDTARLTSSEEHLRLGHELGHCQYAGFYSRSTPYELRGRIEHKADVWQIRKEIPLDELRAAIHDGKGEVWQLAEYFDLPEENIRQALHYYTETLGLSLDK